MEWIMKQCKHNPKFQTELFAEIKWNEIFDVNKGGWWCQVIGHIAMTMVLYHMHLIIVINALQM